MRDGCQVRDLPVPNQMVDAIGQRQVPGPTGRPVEPLPLRPVHGRGGGLRPPLDHPDLELDPERDRKSVV